MVTGMLEFHGVVGDLLSSVIRRLSVRVAQVLGGRWAGKSKQLVSRDLVGPALEDKRCFSQKRLPPG